MNWSFNCRPTRTILLYLPCCCVFTSAAMPHVLWLKTVNFLFLGCFAYLSFIIRVCVISRCFRIGLRIFNQQLLLSIKHGYSYLSASLILTFVVCFILSLSCRHCSVLSSFCIVIGCLNERFLFHCEVCCSVRDCINY